MPQRARAVFPPLSAVVLTCLLACPAARAAVPVQMSYQGVLTDGAGNLVADGPYKLGFTLYDAPTGGTALWNEVQPNVPVSKGSFSVLLGSVIPLTLSFDQPYWLGVAVNSGPELVPRVALASSPYALGLRTPFRPTSNDSTPTLWAINPSGWDALRVSSSFKIYPGGANPAFQQLYDPTGNPSLQLIAGGNGFDTSLLITNPNTGAIPAYLGTASGHPGTNFGGLTVGGLNNSRFLRVDGYNGGTGDPKLTIQSGVSNIVLDSHQSGDAAVQLPPGSIGPSEIAGLPGMSLNHRATNLAAVPISGFMADVDTVSIVVPAAGYVTLDACAQVSIFAGPFTDGYVGYQIDDGTGPAPDATQTLYVGSNPILTNATMYFGVQASRTYFKAPGAYTMHLKMFFFTSGQVGSGSGTPAAYVVNPSLRAMFFPVSYGPVQTAVLGPELSQFDHATPVVAGAGGVPSVPGGAAASGPQAYTVDLRDLELRAARAAAEAAKARNALLEAEAAQSRPEMLRRNDPAAARVTPAAAAR